MTELPGELGIEVEALEHLYGHDAFTISSHTNSTTLTMPLLPRQLDGEHEAYVAAKLVLKLDNSSYPTTAPTVILEEAKGLTDAACVQLQASLQAEALNLAGEMVLGHLCELALDLLTAVNHPNGTCIFCLEDLVSQSSSSSSSSSIIPDSNSGGGSYHVLKLPCFHCFHIPCFTAWFQWQQSAEAAAAAETSAPTSQGPNQLLPTSQDVECTNGWVAKNIFTIKCPSCRLEVPPIALRHALPLLLLEREGGGSGGGVSKIQNQIWPPTEGASTAPAVTTISTNTTSKYTNDSNLSSKNSNMNNNCFSVQAWSSEHPRPQDVLSSESLQQLVEMQRQFQRVLDLQRARGGLVQENVAVSVAELEAVAAEKRQKYRQQKIQQQGEAKQNQRKQEKEGASANSNVRAGRSRGGGQYGGRQGGSGRGGQEQNGPNRGRGSSNRGGSGGSRGRGRGHTSHPPPPSSQS